MFMAFSEGLPGFELQVLNCRFRIDFFGNS